MLVLCISVSMIRGCSKTVPHSPRDRADIIQGDYSMLSIKHLTVFSLSPLAHPFKPPQRSYKWPVVSEKRPIRFGLCGSKCLHVCQLSIVNVCKAPNCAVRWWSRSLMIRRRGISVRRRRLKPKRLAYVGKHVRLRSGDRGVLLELHC